MSLYYFSLLIYADTSKYNQEAIMFNFYHF